MTVSCDERDRVSVVRDLESPDEDVRRLAVERAGVLPVEEALGMLLESLGDVSWRVRKAAIERLVARPEVGEVATVLVGALADGENPGRRNGAVEALVRCGATAVPALVAASGSDDPDVRKLVVDSLAGIGDACPGQVLIDLLEDSDPNVRAAVADALAASGVKEAAPRLLYLVRRREEDSLVRFAALRALAAVDASVAPEQLQPAFEEPILRGPALGLLAREDGPGAAPLILEGLTAGARSVRESAMRAVLRLLSAAGHTRAEDLVEQARQSAQAAPLLLEDAVERLSDADLPTRLVLVQFLGLLKHEAAVVPMLLAGRDEALAEVVFATLGRFGEAAERRIDAAWDGFDIETRRRACELFARSADSLARARLVATLEDPDTELRIAAAQASAARGVVAALPALVRQMSAVACSDDVEGEEELSELTDALTALAGSSAEARARAMELLKARLDGTAGDLRLAFARPLCRIAAREDGARVGLLLKDASAEVRKVAAEAFVRFAPDEAPEALRLALADEDAGVRLAAAGALASRAGNEVIDDLRRLADDADDRVRAAGVHGLAKRLRSSDSDEIRAAAQAGLESALADRPLVALAALDALTELGGALAMRAASVLERPEPELVREAVRCLGLHADSESLPVLVPLVSHPDWSVRAEAIEVLSERGVRRAAPAILRRLEAERDGFVRDAILRALQRLEG